MKAHRISSLLIVLSLALNLPVRADPDRHDSRGPRPAKVVLYSGTHFTGERIELAPGEKIDDFRYAKFPSGRGANNRVSSIEIQGDLEVSMFEFRSFNGDELKVRRSVADLGHIDLAEASGSWNNTLSSIIVRNAPGRDRHDDDRHGDNRHDDRGHPGPEGPRDREVTRMVTQAYRDVLGREPDPSGLKLYIGILEDRGWSEDRLRDQLMSGDEYKRVVVPREVKAIYLEVLGREADPAGLSFYCGKVVNGKWTFGRVREALRKSPEYRARKNRR